jgi:hypothetical protein
MTTLLICRTHCYLPLARWRAYEPVGPLESRLTEHYRILASSRSGIDSKAPDGLARLPRAHDGFGR